jgi:hypothetical protein
MKYQAPYGVTDTNAPYVNGDPSRGIQGSIPPAAAFEYPMREIVGVISKSMISPSDTDLLQMAESIRSQRMNYCNDTGQANTLSVAFDPPLAIYTLGLLVRVRVAVTNNGPCTIDAGAGRVAIKRPNGAALQPNDMPAGGMADLVYDGSAFQLMSGLGGIGGATTINYATLPYCVDTSNTPNLIVAPFSPALTAQQAGTAFLVRVSNTNTGPTTITVNALTNKQVRANVDSNQLLPGDVAAGSVVLFVFDGTNYYIDPNPLIPANVTLNVPAQFGTVTTALNAISRKTIGSQATVTIQIATSVIGPFTIYHKDSDRIVIAGTTTGPPITWGMFAQSGNSAAQRAQDAATNIIMLRSHYGTEVRFTGAIAGVENQSAGMPLIKDLLITGDGSAISVGVRNAVSSPLQKTILTNNVSVWGCYFGCYTGGKVQWGAGSVSNCYAGINAQNGGDFHSGGIAVIGNYEGALVGPNSTAHFQNATFNVNGDVGLLVAGNSGVQFEGGAVAASGTFDVYAYNSSVVMFVSTTVNTFSPPLFTIGNWNSLITGQ